MKKLALIFLIFIECDSTIQFPIPSNTNTEISVEVNSSIQVIWERVQQSETGFIQFEASENELWVEGYVTSSDAAGNFYKELYIQDSPKDPKRGLRFLVDKTALHNLAPKGSKVYIRLNGLGAGIHQGVLSLGTYEADGVASLPAPLIEQHLKRTNEVFELEALPTDLNELSPNLVGLYLQLESVQFSSSEQGKSFSSEAFDDFDGERWLVSCAEYRSLILSSSTFSKFKSVLIDSLSGSIKGILTRDYFNEKNIFKINHPEEIQFQNSRCDPYFEENFESEPLGKFEKEGWINWIEKGSKYWEVYEDENSLGQSLQIGSYRSGDAKTISWLITPELKFESLQNPQFGFRTSTSFLDKSELEVFYSYNFNGAIDQIKEASWKPLNAIIATEQENDRLWIDSGEIALTAFNRPVYIAFRYSGSGKTAEDGTFELDDIRLYEKP